jgi:hypothetical protein
MVGYKLIAAKNVCEIWPTVEKYIAQAVETSPGEYSVEDLKQAAEADVMDLWVICTYEGVRGAFMTYFVRYPQHRICIGAYAASDIQGNLWEGAIDICMAWARDNNCARFCVDGRKGWERALKDMGFSFDYARMSVCLN